MIHLRPVKGSERPLLEYLHTASLPSDTFPDFLKGFWWIAWDGAAPVAFAGLTATGDTGYLCRAGVIPDYRGKGLQRRLIRVRVNKARRLGLAWLVTDTYRNPVSSNNLIDAGFRMFTPIEPWAADDAVHWRLHL